MTVYLDPSALALPAGGAGRLAPGAGDALSQLAEAGFAVVLVGSAPPAPIAGLREAPLPAQLEPADWFLTGDTRALAARPRGGTTMLVGPRPPVGKLPLPRFDMEARDLHAAAIEILARSAMP